MKYSESWLREWVNPKLTREELCHSLTMAGLEVEDVQPAAAKIHGVVVGEIIALKPHPTADLQICDVNIGEKKHLQIVCGAKNVSQGMKVAVAKINASLPHGLKIERSIIKETFSEGMLCSAKELGLAEESDIILQLAADAVVGQDLWAYFALADYVIDVSITPNRGDCLSIKGLAREISAITKTRLNELKIKPVKSKTKRILPVYIENTNAPNYVGRVIQNVNAAAATPVWLSERLRRSGIRSISPIVDVTNYVMLEIGQPMHAFDLEKIDSCIKVRNSKKGEEIVLLDGSTHKLDNKTMVIADAKKPLAVAGVMGGLDSAVTLLTKNIFLESAYFIPQEIARQRQAYNLDSDSAYRFERGIDPTIQEAAIQRASELILEICGGEAGPIIVETVKDKLPKSKTIKVPHAKITKVLGVEIPAAEIEAILRRLHFKLNGTSKTKNNLAWQVIPPRFRPDITLVEDVIEEVARIHGYNNIPTHQISSNLFVQQPLHHQESFNDLKQRLTDLGYQEIVTYSFIDNKLHELLAPNAASMKLTNPISSEMTEMRTSLWPGLITTLKYNISRQQPRLKLFEIGSVFSSGVRKSADLPEKHMLAGLFYGSILPEQWGATSREVDFFDMKGDLEHLLADRFGIQNISYEAVQTPILHPKQSAAIHYKGQNIGKFGRLHPNLVQKLDINDPVFLFELDLALLKNKPTLQFQDVSKFPEIRRDLALLVNEAIPAKDIQDTIRRYAGDWLKEVFIFDVYQGKGISPGLKSVALAVVLQHPARTLIDNEVAELMERVVAALKEQLGAELRS